MHTIWSLIKHNAFAKQHTLDWDSKHNINASSKLHVEWCSQVVLPKHLAGLLISGTIFKNILNSLPSEHFHLYEMSSMAIATHTHTDFKLKGKASAVAVNTSDLIG